MLNPNQAPRKVKDLVLFTNISKNLHPLKKQGNIMKNIQKITLALCLLNSSLHSSELQTNPLPEPTTATHYLVERFNELLNIPLAGRIAVSLGLYNPAADSFISATDLAIFNERLEKRNMDLSFQSKQLNKALELAGKDEFQRQLAEIGIKPTVERLENEVEYLKTTINISEKLNRELHPKFKTVTNIILTQNNLIAAIGGITLLCTYLIGRSIMKKKKIKSETPLYNFSTGVVPLLCSAGAIQLSVLVCNYYLKQNFTYTLK